jgi:hypothetical protein
MNRIKVEMDGKPHPDPELYSGQALLLKEKAILAQPSLIGDCKFNRNFRIG